MATLEATNRIDTIRAAKKLAKALKQRKADKRAERDERRTAKALRNIHSLSAILEVC